MDKPVNPVESEYDGVAEATVQNYFTVDILTRKIKHDIIHFNIIADIQSIILHISQ